jgi:hypothetical protein
MQPSVFACKCAHHFDDPICTCCPKLVQKAALFIHFRVTASTMLFEYTYIITVFLYKDRNRSAESANMKNQY